MTSPWTYGSLVVQLRQILLLALMRSVVLLLWLATLTLFVGESVAAGYLAESNGKSAVVVSETVSAPVSADHHRMVAEQTTAIAGHDDASDHMSGCAANADGDASSPHGDKDCSCSAGACNCIINLGLAMPVTLAVTTASEPQHSAPPVLRYGSIPSKEWHPPFRPPILYLHRA